MSLRPLIRTLILVSLPALACADRDLTGTIDPNAEEERPFAVGSAFSECDQGDDCLDEWCLSPVNEPGFCTQVCDPNDADISTYCEDVTAGTATTVCLPIGSQAACALDCAEGRQCPPGMRCEEVDIQGDPRWVCF